MDISALIPTPDSIPVHSGILTFLHTLTFMVHILLMNILVGTGIISLISQYRPSKGTYDMGKTISDHLTILFAFTVVFGVAPFLFIQALFGQFIYVSTMLMGWYWLSIVALLILGYYSAYYCKFNFSRLDTTRAYYTGGTVVSVLVIAFFFTNNMTLMLTPEAWVAYFSNPNGTWLNLSDPTVLPRFFHFMASSVAVGGLFTAIVWYFKGKKGAVHARENMDAGMKWFTITTIFQIIIGFWFQMSLPREIMLLFMGTGKLHTLVFSASLILVIAVIVFGMKRNVWATTFSLIPLVFFMVIMRHLVRAAYLEPYFKLTDIHVTGQYSPFVFFMVSLIAGVAIIVYVLRLAAAVDSHPETRPS